MKDLESGEEDIGVSLAGLSWPLFIGGHVSRIWSGSIQISSYNMNYNMTLTRPLFHGPLPEQASMVPTSWALVFIPLSVAAEILSKS
jgi:hypothetical protein